MKVIFKLFVLYVLVVSSAVCNEISKLETNNGSSWQSNPLVVEAIENNTMSKEKNKKIYILYGLGLLKSYINDDKNVRNIGIFGEAGVGFSFSKNIAIQTEISSYKSNHKFDDIIRNIGLSSIFYFSLYDEITPIKASIKTGVAYNNVGDNFMIYKLGFGIVGDISNKHTIGIAYDHLFDAKKISHNASTINLYSVYYF